MASKFYLRQGKNKKAENGRPWIYIDEINEYDGDYENGDIVEVYNHKNYFIGKGYINDHSKITIRIMTRDINEEIDEEFFKRRFAAAWDYRKTVIDTSSCRFIFGEADFLPGLTIDKFKSKTGEDVERIGLIGFEFAKLAWDDRQKKYVKVTSADTNKFSEVEKTPSENMFVNPNLMDY